MPFQLLRYIYSNIITVPIYQIYLIYSRGNRMVYLVFFHCLFNNKGFQTEKSFTVIGFEFPFNNGWWVAGLWKSIVFHLFPAMFLVKSLSLLALNVIHLNHTQNYPIVGKLFKATADYVHKCIRSWFSWILVREQNY